MNLRILLLLAAAVITAGLTAVFARNWMAAQQAALERQVPAPAQAAPIATTDILVAADDLALGSFIRAEAVRWQPWPNHALADGHITRQAEAEATLDGAVTRRSLVAGEPLMNRFVVHPGERGFLAAVLEPGRRAVSVPVNATTGISGFIFPGDRVDILLTFRTAEKDRESKRAETRQYSQTLLRDIRVLAIDQHVENDDGSAQVADTATLEVTPKEAETIALGLQLGTLSLSLRGLVQDVASGGSDVPMAARGTGDDGGDAEQRSFTADRDVFFMVGERDDAGADRGGAYVLRGSAAEAVSF